MKNFIGQIKITVEPWIHGDNRTQLRVETVVNGVRHSFVCPLSHDDFISRFDYLMEEASRELKRLVEIHRP